MSDYIPCEGCAEYGPAPEGRICIDCLAINETQFTLGEMSNG